MKRRTALYILLGALFVVFLIACATALQTGYSRDPAEWLRAHRTTPLLWLIDFSAVYALLLTRLLIVSDKFCVNQSQELMRAREEHHMQMDELLVQTEELEKTNAQNQEKIEALEAADATRQESFEQEARRLTEQAFRALQSQVDAHTRQLEAVNLALQYHRAELKQLRHGIVTEGEPNAGLLTNGAVPAASLTNSDRHGALPPATGETDIAPPSFLLNAGWEVGTHPHADAVTGSLEATLQEETIEAETRPMLDASDEHNDLEAPSGRVSH